MIGVNLPASHGDIDKSSAAPLFSFIHPDLNGGNATVHRSRDAGHGLVYKRLPGLQSSADFGRQIHRLRGHLQDRLPCSHGIGFLFPALVQLGLAQPCHEIAAVGINSSVQRLQLALVIVLRPACRGYVAPQGGRSGVMARRLQKKPFGLCKALRTQCQHPLTI